MSSVKLGNKSLIKLPNKDQYGFLAAASKIKIPALLLRPLFLIIFAIPNLLAVLYFALIASPVYISTSVMTVFNPSQSSSSIVSLLSGGSSDGSSEEGYILGEYIASWGEFQKIAQQMDLASHYERGDFVSRYGGLSTGFQANDVTLWHYYQAHVLMTVDVKSGIVLLDVRGYDPTFTVKLANVLLSDSIHHMDNMNNQQEQDFIGDAQNRKDQLSSTVQQDEAALDTYRSQIGLYDPKALYASDLDLLNSLTLKDVDLETQYKVMSQATPNNPAVEDIVAAIQMVKKREAVEEEKVPAIAAASTVYENLVVTRDNDESLLQQATVAVQDAQLKATQNRYYLNVISAPSQPVTPELPRRLTWIAGFFLVTIILWGLLR